MCNKMLNVEAPNILTYISVAHCQEEAKTERKDQEGDEFTSHGEKWMMNDEWVLNSHDHLQELLYETLSMKKRR